MARDSSAIHFLEINTVPSKSVKPSAVKDLESFTAKLPNTATFSDRVVNVLTRLELLQQVNGITRDGLLIVTEKFWSLSGSVPLSMVEGMIVRRLQQRKIVASQT